MNSKEIRQSFLKFFEEREHKIVPSASLIPAGDPTLLFTNAGMNQFKDIFLGREKREYLRAADSQKCIRVAGKHNDLEDVGKDTYHHTFFEMLGNWSFGDYYKREAILFAWELLTKEWQIPKELLWATVYEEDDEAAQLWTAVTDLPPSRLVRFGKKDNFWEMGDTGPCGPCSEIHIEWEPGSSGHQANPVDNPNAFRELWNLVFIQYTRLEDGSLQELPKKHVDTGMGFERITAVLQGKKSNYDTDLFIPIIELTEEITGKSYRNGNEHDGIAFRVVADHIRALSFAIADGIIPANEGRGYVLRRILRRAVKYGRNLGVHDPFLYRLAARVADVMGEAYPEVLKKNTYCAMIIKAEEESFGQTIDRGIEIFEEVSSRLLARNITVFPGDSAFKLHDTYGFPLDLTALLAREKGMRVTTDAFTAAMDQQKERSRKDRGVVVYGETSEPNSRGPRKKTHFDYKKTELETKVIKILDDENHPIETASTGSHVRIYLPKTPFYGESGGQVGDQGTITAYGKKGVMFVRDTRRISPTEIVHYGEIVEGELSLGDTVMAAIDYSRRLAIMRNHTATHLLHKALKEVLGTHVNQSGSLVAPEYLRFDFNHFKKMSKEEIKAVEEKVNARIRENLTVAVKTNVPFQEAVSTGATALFGEKYGEKVRVITIDKYSQELCGGTHLNHTGQIGFFKIIGEMSVAAGIRRIEAVTGESAHQWAVKEQEILEEAMVLLNVKEDNFIQRIEQLLEERKELDKKLRDLRTQASIPEFDQIMAQGEDINHRFKFYSGQLTVENTEELMKLGDLFRQKVRTAVGVFGVKLDGKALIMTVITDDLISEERLHAGEIVKEVARLIGGGGGRTSAPGNCRWKKRGEIIRSACRFQRNR